MVGFSLAMGKEVKAHWALMVLGKQHKNIIPSSPFVCCWTFSTWTQNRLDQLCEDSQFGSSAIEAIAAATCGTYFEALS